MSMINDALRRASSAARGNSVPLPMPPALSASEEMPPPMPASASAFQAPPPLALPEDSLPPGLEADETSGARSNKKMPLILAVVLAGGVAVAMNHLLKRNQEKTVDVSANASRKVILPHASAMQTVAQTLAAVTNRAAAATTAAPIAVAAAPVLAVAPSPSPKFPPLRLQSIFYRPSNPSVMINGRTLFLDDEVQGVTVADIQPSSVTLVLSGHTNVLTLR